jgi:hypothetical protein
MNKKFIFFFQKDNELCVCANYIIILNGLSKKIYIIILNKEHKENLEENKNTNSTSNYIFIKKMKVSIL